MQYFFFESERRSLPFMSLQIHMTGQGHIEGVTGIHVHCELYFSVTKSIIFSL